VRADLEKPDSPRHVILACFNQIALDAYRRAGIAEAT